MIERTNVNKPEDFDFIIYGDNTRFVIFEKTEDVSKNFPYKMKKYWRFSTKILLDLIALIQIKKTKKQ